MLKVYKIYATQFLKKLKKQDGDWGYIVGVAAGLIVAAFILIPQVRLFATGAMTAMTTWWATVRTTIFPTT